MIQTYINKIRHPLLEMGTDCIVETFFTASCKMSTDCKEEEFGQTLGIMNGIKWLQNKRKNRIRHFLYNPKIKLIRKVHHQAEIKAINAYALDILNKVNWQKIFVRLDSQAATR